MKILISLGHPAHVHYFRNFIIEMKNRGHQFLLIAKDKEVTYSLLNAYNFDYVPFGRKKKSLLGKAFDLFLDDVKLLRHSLRFRADIYISFSSVIAGHISWLLNRPHIVFDDTEHSKLEHIMYKPFASSIVTPSFFMKDMGKKQIKIDSFFELCYLHPNYFMPDDSILKTLGVKHNEKFVLLRFISWDAVHDKGQSGISMDIKMKAVSELSKYARVFISSEAPLPECLLKYQIKMPPEKIHDVISISSLFFGESGTMAVESALLGTPSVRVSTLASSLGNFKELKEKYQLVEYYSSGEDGLDKALELIKDDNSKTRWRHKRDLLIKDKLDFTSFIIWFVENYPKTRNLIKESPILLNQFKYNKNGK
jgi:predicted glycosyltransferase